MSYCPVALIAARQVNEWATQSIGLLAPNAPEPIGIELRVADRVLDVGVAHVIL